MARYALEMANIVRLHGEQYLRMHALNFLQRKALRDIVRCRTAELGGHVYRCDGCSYEENSYNSCRSRHCPKCQGSKAQQWVDDRTDELLPVSYFHTVFTLPHQFHALVLQNQRLMYDLLFKAVSRTLLAVGQRKLHAKLGFLCLLHTWGQTLTLHPHLHVLIPGCGIDAQGAPVRFHARYLLSDKVLSRVFCGKFIALLKRAYRKGKLSLKGDLSMLANENEFERLLNEATAAHWVVRSKAPFRGPTVVLKYLARYTQRVAISNSRLLSLDENGYVSFTYRNYRQGGAVHVMRLSASDFLSRFLLHVLPKSFVRVRYYGFLSRGRKNAALPLLRSAFEAAPTRQETPLKSHSHICPRCHTAPLRLAGTLAPLLPICTPSISSVHGPPPLPGSPMPAFSQAA